MELEHPLLQNERFLENGLLNGTYLMQPWSVEDNLIFLRNGTDFPARPFIVSELKLSFIYFLWANELHPFISL